MAPELKLALFFLVVLGLSALGISFLGEPRPHVEAAGMMLAKPVHESEA